MLTGGAPSNAAAGAQLAACPGTGCSLLGWAQPGHAGGHRHLGTGGQDPGSCHGTGSDLPHPVAISAPLAEI